MIEYTISISAKVLYSLADGEGGSPRVRIVIGSFSALAWNNMRGMCAVRVRSGLESFFPALRSLIQRLANIISVALNTFLELYIIQWNRSNFIFIFNCHLSEGENNFLFFINSFYFYKL